MAIYTALIDWKSTDGEDFLKRQSSRVHPGCFGLLHDFPRGIGTDVGCRQIAAADPAKRPARLTIPISAKRGRDAGR
jgi:hypothetical protein